MDNQNQTTQYDPQAVAMVRALKMQESGNKYDTSPEKAGNSLGGAYMYQAPTWKAYAGDILGDANASFTPENQDKVTYGMVKKWKDSGMQPEEIAHMWNPNDSSYPKQVIGKLRNIVSQGKGFVNPAQKQPTSSNNFVTPPQTQPQSDTSTPNMPAPVQEQHGGGLAGFGGSVVSGILKPFARLGTNLVQAGEIATGNKTTQPFDSKFLGEVKPVGMANGGGLSTQNLKDAIGTGLDVSGNVVGGVGAGGIAEQGLKGLIKEGLITGAKAGAVTGGLQSSGRALQENKSLGQTAIQGGTGVIAGGALGGLLGGATGAVGAGLEKLGVSKIAQNRVTQVNPQEIIDMVNPKLNARQVQTAIKGGQALKSGILGDISLKPSTKTIRAAEAVAGIVDPKKTLVENINLTREALAQEADMLKNNIALQDHPYTFKELQSKLNALETPISLKNDEIKILGKVKKAAMDIAKRNGGTVSSLLDTRKDFDALIEKEFPTLYDRANATMKNGILAVREGLNSFIEKNLPADVGFRKSLAKQTAMFNAIDGMATKASGEIGTNTVGRTIQKHPVITGLLKSVGRTIGAGEILKNTGILP